MKTSFKFLALFTAAAYPAMAFADVAGLSAPVAVAAETGLYVYGSAFIALMALSDYTRRARVLRLPSPVLMPAKEAFASGSAVGARRPASPRAFRAPQLS